MLRGIIRGNDGQTYSSLDELFGAPLTRYLIIVPESMVLAACPSMSDASRAVSTVNLWWIERCIQADKFIEPDDYPFARPFKRIKIPEMGKMTIAITQFSGVDYLHVHKAISLLGTLNWLCIVIVSIANKSIGAQFSEQFSKSKSLLIVNTAIKDESGDKVKAAETWGIPMVSQEWLYDCVLEGECLPFEKYLLNETTPKVEDVIPIKEEPVTQETKFEVLNGCTVKLDPALKVCIEPSTNVS